ncbi:MAG: molybdenum cofactor biosynthesis protein MoaE, partial [Actinomycetota bacterium]|nr:molybdenum cofactor biosynthesis protein MoaE [Actinomycetota bacterium]
MFAIVEGPIDVAALISSAQRPDCGAISAFVGTTRVDACDGASVEHLEYEAYRPMADRKLEEIGAEIKERWDAREVSIVHRIGKVEPGEASVAIVIAAPRRGPAFEASRYAIERIK